MPQEIRIALRDWDWLTPWALGEVDDSPLREQGCELRVDRLPAVLDLLAPGGYAGGEVSLSQYVRRIASGSRDFVALPHLLMQGFRHRCVIVAADSRATSPGQLAGGRIGVTGWADSGSIWTRAALAGGGLGIEDARWCAGRLTEDHPEFDRLEGHGIPGRIEAVSGKPMLDRLADGELDAILTPFMPPGFYDRSPRFRPLLPDVRAAERRWADERGHVPGHHVLAFAASVRPEIRLAVSRMLRESRRRWIEQRRKYAETTAWAAVDFWDEARFLPAGWDRPGLRHQGRMLEDFVGEAVRQRILDAPVPLADLFPVDVPDEPPDPRERSQPPADRAPLAESTPAL